MECPNCKDQMECIAMGIYNTIWYCEVCEDFEIIPTKRRRARGSALS